MPESTEDTGAITTEKILNRLNEAVDAVYDARQTICGAADSIERSRLTAVEAWAAAHEAKTESSAAKSLAEEAKSLAEGAKTKSEDAKTTADAANLKANAVETAAEGAQTAAQSALATSNAAKTAADSANGTAGQAQIAAANAQTVAGNAQSLANQAKTAADKAVVKTGARGQLAGSETAQALSGSQTININASDCINLATSGVVTLTFQAAAATVRAVKVICLTASASTLLQISGASWANKGSVPTWGNAGKRLILVAHFVAGAVVLTVADNNQ